MTSPPPQGTQLFQSLNHEKQEKVFQAAVDEFASKGYRSASMNSLVKAAGISKGSLFQYFKTKQDLFGGVVDIAASRVKGHLKRVRDDTADMSLSSRLAKLLRAGFVFIDEHPMLARIYFRLLQTGEAPFGGDRLMQLRRDGDEFLGDLIKQAIDRGEVRPDVDVERTAYLINTMFESLLRAYYTEFLGAGLGIYQGRASELDKWIEATVTLISKGLEKA
jgi:AcrR family transcriptional regulator